VRRSDATAKDFLAAHPLLTVLELLRSCSPDSPVRVVVAPRSRSYGAAGVCHVSMSMFRRLCTSLRRPA